MVIAVFVRIAVPRTRFSLWSKSLRNLVSMAKISLHALSILKNHMTEFLRINYGRFSRKMSLMISYYAPFSHCTLNEGLCLGKWQALKTIPWRRWTPARVSYATSPFHCLHKLDQQMQLSWWVCHNWKLQYQSCAVRWWFGSAFIHRIWSPERFK